MLSGISEKFLYEIENEKKIFGGNISDDIRCTGCKHGLHYKRKKIKGKKRKKCGDRIINTLERFNVENLDSLEQLLKVAYELSLG